MGIEQLLPIASAAVVVAAKSIRPPPQPELPFGWQRWTKHIKRTPDNVVLAAANHYLYTLPMGGFQPAVDGSGLPFAVFIENHFDDHVSPGVIKWHRGASLLVPL